MVLFDIVKTFFLRVYKAVARWVEEGAGLMAAGVSYYLAVSLFPLLLILVAGFGMFFRFTQTGKDARGSIAEVIASQTSPQMGQRINDLLDNIEDQSTSAGPLGMGALLFTAMLAFTAFDRAFNRILRIPEDEKKKGISGAVKGVLINRLKAFLMLGALGLLLLLTLIASVTLEGIHQYYSDYLPGARWLWQWLSVGVGFVLNVILFTVLYHEIPNTKVRWGDAFQGSVLAAVIWEIGRQILASVVVGDKFSAYGIVGSFIAILVWVYYGVAVIFLGAEYIEVIGEERRNHKEAGTASNRS